MTRFNTTRWSLIAEACNDGAGGRPALEQLCRDYRPPVLAYVRGHGYSHADAEDLTQEFFARFIEHGWYSVATPERGRFRALLLTALRRFIQNSRAHDHAHKRGGDVHHVALDDESTAADMASPEQAFMRSWLAVLIERARARLQEEYRGIHREVQFERLWPCVDGRADSDELTAIAAALGLRRNTVAVQLHRLRLRLRQLIRLELLATVGSREDLDAELSELRGSLGIDLTAVEAAA
ncbi:MAG: sigma-70 family RNA polymerase sigma factor [Pseudomonadota bacterium]|nr:sigma-70 family RNA polymerase sigma factor [Pseudomonadota bacterium]